MCRYRSRALRIVMIGAAIAAPLSIAAQTPAPAERVRFDEAVARAIARNPSTAIAAAGILRAEALLTEARSAAFLQVNGNVTTTTLNRGVEFDGATVTPRNQLTASLDLRVPLYAPARWARRAQADDGRRVAAANADEVRRETAFAAAWEAGRALSWEQAAAEALAAGAESAVGT